MNVEKLEPSISTFIGDRMLDASKNIFEDVQELLPHIDILISDCSGAWLDYLLLNCPIVFVPYDLEEFEKETGLFYNHDFVIPGPKVATAAELIEALREYIRYPEKDSERRQLIKGLFHQYDDGRSYERLYEIVKPIT